MAIRPHTITRRDFLKRIGSFIIGIIALQLGRIFAGRKSPYDTALLKEARHYQSGDHLAG